MNSYYRSRAPSIRYGPPPTQSANWRRPEDRDHRTQERYAPQPDQRIQGKDPCEHRPSVFRSNPPNKSIVIPRQDIKPGVIIRAPLHQQDFKGVSQDTEVTAIVQPVADHNVTRSKFGDIFTKFRKMIVIACYENHFVAIPMYTHNGVGLRYKKKPEEYISVKDHRSGENFRPLSKYGTLVTKYLSPAVMLYDPATTAHITYPVSRAYNIDCTPEGELDAESTKNLIRLADRMAPMQMFKMS